MSFQDIADCMKFGLAADADSSSIDRFMRACEAAAADMGISYFLDSGLTEYQAAAAIRGSVVAMVSDIAAMSQVALSRGYLIPDSPFPTIDKINSNRRLFASVTNPNANALFKAAVDLSKISAGYKNGTITFDRSPAYQLSSYEISVDGMTKQSGDPLVDILGYQPDGDSVKRKRALDSLSKLDFSKRKPYLLFTADFGTGIVVCWGKMHDASGYNVSRRDVFSGIDLPTLTFSNDDLQKSTQRLMGDDRFYQTLTFYDWLDHGDVMAFIDESTSPDRLYSFAVSGIQKKSPGSKAVFDVPTSAMFLSPAVISQVQNSISKEATAFSHDPSSVSPYPALAQALYGDSGYGWILAGCNMLAAVRRGDDQNSVRSLGFIGSTLDGITSAGRAGKLVIPTALGDVQKAVEDSISAFGVSQTIVSVLDGTGLTEFISGKDDPNGISDTNQSVDAATSGLARILSAIDPATATIDPHVLAVSVQSTAGKTYDRSVFVRLFDDVPSISLEQAIGTETIDLTTYGGIARLMQVLRTIYDFYPGALS